MNETFVCGTCGKSHVGPLTDHGYKLPDEVWAIPEPQRAERAKFTADLCQFEGRYFIRCILFIPFTDGSGNFGWGVWVNVEPAVFDRYLALYEADGSGEPLHPGRLANVLPAYDEPLGTKVAIQFGSSTQRPTVHLPPDAESKLALEQRQGIGSSRYHEYLTAVSALRSAQPSMPLRDG
ncbi:MAG TPA: DUF2199 domain-containing protein [Stellaceae bacterium]|nr:DUF2199 domain-containing protein [Stellaceae bacterium]